MPLHSWDVSIVPGGERISFWARREYAVYAHQEDELRTVDGYVLDVASKSVVAKLSAALFAPPIAWNESGVGVIATRDSERQDTQLRFIGPPDCEIIREMTLDCYAAGVHWVSDSRLALVTVQWDAHHMHPEPDGAGQGQDDPTNSMKWDLSILDLETGGLTTLTAIGDAMGPVCRIDNGEIWCARDPGRSFTSSQVYSADGKNVIWASPGHMLDTIACINPGGRILVLNTCKSPLGVVGQIVRHPKRANRVLPTLVSREARPTAATVIDGKSGRVVWKSLPGEVITGAFGLGDNLAVSVVLPKGRYGVSVYDIPTGAETLIAEGDRVLTPVGETPHGWVLVEEESRILLANASGSRELFASMAMKERSS